VVCRNSQPRLIPAAAALVAAAIALSPGSTQAQPFLLVGNYSSNTIVKYNAVTGGVIANPFIALGGSGGGHDIVLDNHNHVFVSDVIAGTVGEFNATTGAAINPSFITTVNPRALALDNNNHLFVGQTGGNGQGLPTVAEYDATTGTLIHANFINETGGTLGIALDRHSHLFVDRGISVGLYDATTGATINANFIPDSGIIAVDALDHLFVGGGPRVAEYDATTGATINAALVTNVVYPEGLAVDGNNHLFVSSDNAAAVGEYDATTGAAINANFITGVFGPTGLAFVAAVPEPSSLLLMAAAAGIGVGWRRPRLPAWDWGRGCCATWSWF
jgi:PEP-CTERM motif